MSRTASRFVPQDAMGILGWTASIVLVAILVERRWSTSIPNPVLVAVAFVVGCGCWFLTRAHAATSRPSEPRAFPIGAYVAGVAAFAIGVAFRHGFELRIRGGSADLAHHSAVVHALAASGASGYQDALPSLRFYPVGAHLPAALVARVTELDPLSTTYLFALLAVIGLFAAVAFVALQLRPPQPWATVAILVWVGAAWRAIFLEAVMFNFFYSQEVGLAFAVATLGFAMSPPERSQTAPAWMALCSTAVGACYPTYIVLVLPVIFLWLLRQRAGSIARRVVRASVMLGIPLAAALLSIFIGFGSEVAGHEGAIAPITASWYFGGPVLLFGALLATAVAFAGARGDEGRPSVLSYLLHGPWAMLRLWFTLAVVFLSANWVLFRLGLYGSRYNTVKCIYPVAAGLAVMLGAFVGSITPERLMPGVSPRVRPLAVSAAVVVAAIWSGLFSPVTATITDDQIDAVQFAIDSGAEFGPVAPDAIDYILTVSLTPLDPGAPRAPAILMNDSSAFRSADVFVAKASSTSASTTADGAALSAICHFGTATVYARVGSAAMSYADRCPT